MIPRGLRASCLDLEFRVEGAEPQRFAAAPHLLFKLRIDEAVPDGAAPTPIHALALRCQIRIEPARRSYGSEEAAACSTSSARPTAGVRRCGRMLWTHVTAIVPPFTGAGEADLPVPCSFDFSLACTRYFDAMEGGRAAALLPLQRHDLPRGRGRGLPGGADLLGEGGFVPAAGVDLARPDGQRTTRTRRGWASARMCSIGSTITGVVGVCPLRRPHSNACCRTPGTVDAMNRYRIEPDRSRFAVHADAAGLLSAFAHSPTFAVGRFEGEVRLGTSAQSLELELSVDPESLVLEDRVSDRDRREIEQRMRGEVLEIARHRELGYRGHAVQAESIDQGRYRLAIEGELTLHGVNAPHAIDAELIVFADGLRLGGGSVLRMSEFGIRPVTALGGTIKLKDELQFSFDLAGLPVPS